MKSSSVWSSPYFLRESWTRKGKSRKELDDMQAKAAERFKVRRKVLDRYDELAKTVFGTPSGKPRVVIRRAGIKLP